jgi:hypothetical protein
MVKKLIFQLTFYIISYITHSNFRKAQFVLYSSFIEPSGHRFATFQMLYIFVRVFLEITPEGFFFLNNF